MLRNTPCVHMCIHTCTHSCSHTYRFLQAPRLSSPVTGMPGPPRTWGHLSPTLMTQACQKVSKALWTIASSLKNRSNNCCLKEQKEKSDKWQQEVLLSGLSRCFWQCPAGEGPLSPGASSQMESSRYGAAWECNPKKQENSAESPECQRSSQVGAVSLKRVPGLGKRPLRSPALLCSLLNHA